MNAGRPRPADARSGQRAANGGGAQVVEPVVFGRCSVPVADVGLVPNFPEPRVRPASVAVAQMSGVGFDKLRPFGFVLGRIGPAGEYVALGKAVAIRFGMG